MKRKLQLVSLGCVRNEINSEIMLGKLKENWFFTENSLEAEIIIINTCSFIESATDESIDTILELSEFRKSGKCEKLIVTGCLPERYGEEIESALPEVDFFLGTGAYDRIFEIVENMPNAIKSIFVDPNLVNYEKNPPDRVR